MIIHSPIISGSLTFADGSTFTLPDGGNYSGSFSGSIQIAEVQSHLIPDTNEAYDLGSSTLRFRDIYLSNNTIKMPGGAFGFNDGAFGFTDSLGDPAPIKASVLTFPTADGGTTELKITDGQLTTQVFDSTGSLSGADLEAQLSGSFTGSFLGQILATNGVVSGSSQVVLGSVDGFNTFSSSVSDTFDGLSSNYEDLLGIPSGIVSGSSQVDITATTNYTTVSSHIGSTSNPHSVTAEQVGLGNVTNESKATMFASPTFTGTVAGISSTMVGLGNVDNTSDANKPVSTAQQTEIDTKADLASPTFTGTVAGISKTMVGLGNVDNTSDANKPVSTAQQTEIDTKADIASPTFTGIPLSTTPAADDSSTKIATTAYVQGELTALIGGAPAAFDTLLEISASIANGDSDVVSLTAVVGGKLQKDQNLSDLTDAGTARTNLGLGSLATLSTVNAATITDNSVGAAELNVSGNGTTTQFLRSDGDGTFSWVTPTDTNTTYSVGNGGLTSINFTSTLNSKLSGIAAGATNVTNNNQLTNGAGYITSYVNTTYTAGTGLTLTGTVFSNNITNNNQLTNGAGYTTYTSNQATNTTSNVTFGNINGSTITATGDVIAYSSSDRRLKDNIQNIENPIEKVQQLNGVTWDWNGNADELQQTLPNVGVIAQEVEAVFPQLVHDRENGYKGVDYAKLTGLLIEAIKSQQKQIQELENRIDQKQ